MSDIILKCTDLVSSQSLSLPPLNLQLERNTLTCLTGPAGNEKTLGLRLLGGIDKPAAGTLEILGRDVWKLNDAERHELHRRVGYVSNGTLSADTPDTPEDAGVSPCHQRLAALSRTLLLNPEILFVDDPFGLCEPPLYTHLSARYLEMKQRLKMTLVLATDNVEFANRYADLVLYILPQGLRIHNNRNDPDGFLRLLNPEGVDDYTRAIEG